MLSRERALVVFQNMLLCRRFEEAVIDLWETVPVEGHRHVYIGQEAVGAGVFEVLELDDLLLTAHRNHGHIVMRGAHLGRAMAEILGRQTGFNLGRGGSAGMSCREVGFLATTGQVGGQLGLAIGAAYSQKIKGQGGLVVVFFGDGALEEGIAYEALNMATLYSLPVLFVCENNSVGVTTGRKENEWSSSSLASKELADIPRSLQVRTEVVEASDLQAIHTVSGELVDLMRRDPSPAFIEMRAHRWPGSRFFNPQLVTGPTRLEAAWDNTLLPDNHARWIVDHDPVIRFGRDLIASHQVAEDELLGLDRQILERVQEAREFALTSPELTEDSGLAGTYA